EVEATVEAGTYRSYRAVLAETARRIATRLDWPLPDSRAGFLADSLPGWRPFPDTNPALRRLSDAGYRLGILSNVDDGLLAWTSRHLAAFFETVVTAQQVGSYKPAPAHFTRARSLIGELRWLQAAQMLAIAGPVQAQPKSLDFTPTRRGGGGLLKALWWQAPTLLNPHFATGTKDQDASRIFYEPLAGFDPDGNVIPILAAEAPSV